MQLTLSEPAGESKGEVDTDNLGHGKNVEWKMYNVE